MADILVDSPVLECAQEYLALTSTRQSGALQQELKDGHILRITQECRL
jgi:hypothetical protein